MFVYLRQRYNSSQLSNVNNVIRLKGKLRTAILFNAFLKICIFVTAWFQFISEKGSRIRLSCSWTVERMFMEDIHLHIYIYIFFFNLFIYFNIFLFFVAVLVFQVNHSSRPKLWWQAVNTASPDGRTGFPYKEVDTLILRDYNVRRRDGDSGKHSTEWVSYTRTPWQIHRHSHLKWTHLLKIDKYLRRTKIRI